MAIKNIGSMNSMIENANAKSWTSKSSSNIDLDTGKINIPDGQSKDTKSFGEFLKDSVAQVNNLQIEANTAIEKLAAGEEQSLHETLLAVEKADLAFKTMNQVRQKVVDAYREIMRMQI